MDPKELIQKANEAKKRADDIAAAHYADGKWATVEAKANYDTALNDALDAKKEADGAVGQSEREAKARDIETWQKESAGQLPGMSGAGAKADDDPAPRGRVVEYKTFDDEVKDYRPRGTRLFKADDEVAYTAAFRRFLMEGYGALAVDEKRLAEAKALSVGLDSAGGELVLSEVTANEIIQALADDVLMRRIATVRPPLTTAASLKVRTASDMDAAEWTPELSAGSNDTSTPFAHRALTPHPLKKKVLVSETLLRMSEIDVERWVMSQGEMLFAAAEENGFMTGTGAQQPVGVFTSSLLTTVTAASATVIAYGDLLSTTFSVKAQYRRNASWIMHRTIIFELMSLVDGVGRPLLKEMPNAGTPLNLLGYPLYESEYAPSSSATGLKVAALGDWKRVYWIQDSLAFRVKRLVELYAEDGEIGFHFAKETDGMVVDPNGASLLVMA
jgi:HK97 family phage major capsid protein